jgi:hypothetical protein
LLSYKLVCSPSAVWAEREIFRVQAARVIVSQLQIAYVRFGSKADIDACPSDVCFTPKADIGTQPRNAR